MYTETKTIESIKRLKGSANGNPAFKVTFTDDTVARTGTDSSVAYEIENPEFRDVPVEVMFTPAGRIVGIKVAE